MKRNFYCFTFLFSVLTPAGLFAQNSLGFYVNGAFPKNQLQSHKYQDGYGMSMEYLSAPVFKTKHNTFHLRIGAGFEYFSHGKSDEVKDLVMNTPNNDKGSVYLANDMNAFYLGPKFIFFPDGRISPYLDAFMAIRGFTTRQTSTFNQPVNGYEQSSTIEVFKNRVAHYGLSAGFLLNVSNHVSFDFRVSYSKGPAINHVDLSSVRRHPEYESNLIYDSKRSAVSDVLIFRIGIAFNIFECKICERNRPDKPDDTGDADEYTPDYNYDIPGNENLKPAEVKPVPPPVPTPNH